MHWDQALHAGWRALGVAADDSHFRLPDYGGGFIWLRAAGRGPADIMAALRAGAFYASSGPRLEDVELEGRRLYVRCSPAAAVYWLGDSRFGWSAHAAPGATITEAELEIDERARYVRVEVVDPQGRTAWGQPHLRS